MKTYTLRVRYKRPSETEKFASVEESQDFECHIEDGRVVFPPDALRIIMGKHPTLRRIPGGAEWIGDRPDVYACGALSDDEAQEISKKDNEVADLAMQIMNDAVEPETQPSVEDILRLYGPPAKPKVIGQVVDGEERFEAQGSQSSTS